MRLTQHTEYALRMLIHAALRAPDLITVGEVAQTFELSPTHLTKVAQTLAEHGLVQTVRGRAGGLRLLGDPGTIRLGEVVRATEPDFQMAPCMEPGRGTCAISRSCVLPDVLAQATAAFIAELDKWTLADLIARRAPMLIAIERRRSLATRA